MKNPRKKLKKVTYQNQRNLKVLLELQIKMKKNQELQKLVRNLQLLRRQNQVLIHLKTIKSKHPLGKRMRPNTKQVDVVEKKQKIQKMLKKRPKLKKVKNLRRALKLMKAQTLIHQRKKPTTMNLLSEIIASQ